MNGHEAPCRLGRPLSVHSYYLRTRRGWRRRRDDCENRSWPTLAHLIKEKEEEDNRELSHSTAKMPRGKCGGKSKGRQKTKKKKGHAANRNSNTNNRGNHASSSSTTWLKGDVPNFGRRSQSIHGNYRTLYSRYKAATHRFIDYMSRQAPENIISREGESITPKSMLSAADWMEESMHCLDPNILKDLKLCIRLRSRVSKSVFCGGDAGHKYFLEVLIYCYTKLRRLPKDETRIHSDVGEGLEEGEIAGNRYAAFDMEVDDDDMEEDDEELFPTSPVPRPDYSHQSLTLDELLSSDDRNDAVIFLLTLDELMGAVSIQHKTLVQNIQNHCENRLDNSTMVGHLLEVAITSNFAIQKVQQLEMELQAQHEHLTTPYRLLSTIVMPELTTQMAGIMRNHASKRCGEHDIIVFLGDCIECFFRNPSDDSCRRDTIVQEFQTQYQVDAKGGAEIEQLFLGIDKCIVLEIPTKPERAAADQLRLQIQASSGNLIDSHAWLPGMRHIGGDRAIHHTIRLLQLFGGVIESCPLHKKPEARRGMFGKSPWFAGSSRKIRDLDELLMSDILPTWVTMCRAGIIGKMKFPRESELCPLFMHLRDYVKDPAKPVSWPLAFGVHAILVGILEVGRELYPIVKASKAVFDTFFRQVDYAGEKAKNEDGLHQTAVWKHNFIMVKFMQNLGLDIFEQRSIWNPVCAGTILSIVAYFCNIEAGCSTIDCQAQLRIVLYLYHGLLINDIISEGDIILLDKLYERFKGSKAIWEGTLPKRGELVQRFWISFGMSLKESKGMAALAKHYAQGGLPRDSDKFMEELLKTPVRGRKLTPINPEDLAISYRRVCNQDFSDVYDHYHTPEQRKNAKGSEQYMFAVHTNDTCDAIENEQELLSMNLISISYICEQFVCSMGRAFQYNTVMDALTLMQNLDSRQGFARLFAQHLLGTLDFARDPLHNEFLRIPQGLAALEFMTTFFSQKPTQSSKGFCMPTSNYLWFQALPSGVGEVKKISLSAK